MRIRSIGQQFKIRCIELDNVLSPLVPVEMHKAYAAHELLDCSSLSVVTDPWHVDPDALSTFHLFLLHDCSPSRPCRHSLDYDGCAPSPLAPLSSRWTLRCCATVSARTRSHRFTQGCSAR